MRSSSKPGMRSRRNPVLIGIYEIGLCNRLQKKRKKELFKNRCAADAHIHGYFDNIKHEILLGLLKRCISEKRY